MSPIGTLTRRTVLCSSARGAVGIGVGIGTGAGTAGSPVSASTSQPTLPGAPAGDVRLRTVAADGVEIFYREAGPADAPVLLLLHGFPNSSHYFRRLMPLLAARFRLIAPDLPSFGFTTIPESRGYRYSFESFAKTLGAFIETLSLRRFAMYIFDYGAPVGLRYALTHPEQVTAYITQNGNAYEAGLGERFWKPVRAYWRERKPEQREVLRSRLTLEGVRQAYLEGAPGPMAVAPEAYWLDAALMERPGNAAIQLDLKLDYQTNIALYPEFQAYLRQRRPPILAVWGKHDPAFIPAGAQAFRTDVPDTTVQLLEAGHFALETATAEIAAAIHAFGARIPG